MTDRPGDRPGTREPEWPEPEPDLALLVVHPAPRGRSRPPARCSSAGRRRSSGRPRPARATGPRTGRPRRRSRSGRRAWLRGRLRAAGAGEESGVGEQDAVGERMPRREGPEPKSDEREEIRGESVRAARLGRHGDMMLLPGPVEQRDETVVEQVEERRQARVAGPGARPGEARCRRAAARPKARSGRGS